jgi:hypothetical protein
MDQVVFWRLKKPASGAGEVLETRPEWSDLHEFHHDLRLQIHEKAAYIETRLNYRLPVVADESWILVVNVHER